MRRQLSSALLASSALFSGLLLSSPHPVTAAHPGENGRLAYSDYTGIWTVNPDGSDPQRLTTAGEGSADRLPQWSPGGTHVVFQRDDGVPTELWIVEADGTGERLLFPADTPGWDYAPAWSPDATRVTFTSGRPPGEAPLGHPRLDIWTANPDGTAPRRLTFDATEGTNAELSRWSSTGEWIAFQTVDGVGDDVWPVELIRPDGTGRHVVAPRSSGVFSWSPDGTRIAYPFSANGVSRIYLMDVRTGAERILVERQSPGAFSFPTWSPDGTTVAFLNGTGGQLPTIYLVPAAGGTPMSIGVQAESIAWQPVNEVTFVDARTSPFASAIDWLHEQGWTSGCGIDRFCPKVGLRRGEMASFLSRVLDLPPATTDHFTDDEASIHEEHINRLADAGITTGCGDGRFCPGDDVRRGPMASFLVRAFDLPPASSDHFTDDDGSMHEDDINRIADAGITTGCGDGQFCWRQVVSREQVAAFIERALDPD